MTMSNVYNNTMANSTEALGDAKGIKDSSEKEKKLSRRIVSVAPVKQYEAAEVQKIRKATGMSQKSFASYMGVSDKTVEAWEAGTNHPSGAASRLLNMMEINRNLTEEFPFVKVNSK